MTIRQPEVEQDEVGRRCHQRGGRRPHTGHVETLALQSRNERLADGVVIFDHKNSHACPPFSVNGNESGVITTESLVPDRQVRGLG